MAFLEIVRTAVKLLLQRGVQSSYSQDGEDILLRTFLRKKRGTYIMVGAYRPIQYSNTYSLYLDGWKGLAIDPNLSLKLLFKIFRPRDRFLPIAIGKVAGEATYYRYNDGAYNTLSEEQAKELEGKAYPTFIGSSKVAVRPLADVVNEEGIHHIDLLDIDAEGLDQEVLESHDWSIPPRVIAIEDNHFNPEQAVTNPVYMFLKGKGYELAARAPRTLIFVKKS